MSAYSDEVLADSPVIYYRLNETTGTTLDNLGSAGSSADATTNNTVVTASSLLAADADPAQTFDHDQPTFKATTTYTISQEPLTVEFWLDPLSLAAFGTLDMATIVANASGSTGWSVSFLDNTGVWRFTTHAIKDYDFTSAAEAAVGVTQHLVFVLDTDHDVSIYVDGAFIQTVTHTAGPAATTEPFTINVRNGVVAGFRGVLDEVAVYTTALSAARILAHYNAGTSAFTPKIVLF